jgi:hypothetical protein
MTKKSRDVETLSKKVEIGNLSKKNLARITSKSASTQHQGCLKWRIIASLTLLLIGSTYLLWLIHEYCKPVEYVIPFETYNNIKNRLVFTGSITLKTRSAFLPLRPIHVAARIICQDDSLARYLQTCKDFYFAFPLSTTPKTKGYMQSTLYKSLGHTETEGHLVLAPTGTTSFEGKGEIEYQCPGNYGYWLINFYPHHSECYDRKEEKISIGTTSDLYSQRTNALLMYFAIMSILLAICIELPQRPKL